MAKRSYSILGKGLKCRLISSPDNTPLVTRLTKEHPELTRQQRRALAREADLERAAKKKKRREAKP